MRKHRNLVIGVALLLVGTTGLTSYYGVPISMMGMMDRDGMKAMMKDMMGAQLPPGINPDELPEPASTGARLLARYCTQCHDMPGPGMHSAQAWPLIVERMNQRMQMMSGRGMMGMMRRIKAPTDNELETLIAYLQKHAQQPIDKTQYRDLNTPAGKLFDAVCSQCHDLPDPKQHTAAEWSAVVQRMTRNMELMGKPVPDQAALDTILGFLQKHAR